MRLATSAVLAVVALLGAAGCAGGQKNDAQGGQSSPRVSVSVEAPDESGDGDALDASPSRADAERARDLAWLRREFADDLRDPDVELESLEPKLVSWVAEGGELTAFITVESHRCRKIVLTRERADDDGRAFLRGRLLIAERAVDGGSEREYLAVDPRHRLHRQSGGGVEIFQHGKWVPISGWGVGDGGTTIAVLSYVDREVARWDGVGVELEPECAGPIALLPCAGGGSRECDRCERVRLNLVTEQGGYAGRVPMGPMGPSSTALSCSEPCPDPETESAVFRRVKRSQAFGDAWMRIEPGSRSGPVPAMYRSEARCRRESAR